jgi:hypothetical protein
MFLRNVGWPVVDYTALYPRRQKSSYFNNTTNHLICKSADKRPSHYEWRNLSSANQIVNINCYGWSCYFCLANLQTTQRTGWSKGNTLDLYTERSRLEYRLEHQQNPDWDSSRCPSFLPGKYQDISSLRLRPLPSKSLSMYHSSYSAIRSDAAISRYWNRPQITLERSVYDKLDATVRVQSGAVGRA